MLSISFSGHRTVSDPELVKKRLVAVAEPLILCGAKDFYAGGAIGFDTIAAKTVIELREKYPSVMLHLVLPCAREYQTAKWKESQIREFDLIRSLADTEEFLGTDYTVSCMNDRNKRLVELADILICWYDENRKHSSGTKNTVNMAMRKNIKVINLWKVNEHIVESD